MGSEYLKLMDTIVALYLEPSFKSASVTTGDSGSRPSYSMWFKDLVNSTKVLAPDILGFEI